MTTSSNADLILVGTTGDDTLVGDVGNDRLDGVSGNDYIDAWYGDDTLAGSSGHFDGGPGIDTVVLHIPQADLHNFTYTREYIENVPVAGGFDSISVFHQALMQATTPLGSLYIVSCERVLLNDNYYVLDTQPLYRINEYFMAGMGRTATFDEMSYWVSVSDHLSALEVAEPDAPHASLATLMVEHYVPLWTPQELYDHLIQTLGFQGDLPWHPHDYLMSQVEHGFMDIGAMAAYLSDSITHPELAGILNTIQMLDASYFT